MPPLPVPYIPPGLPSTITPPGVPAMTGPGFNLVGQPYNSPLPVPYQPGGLPQAMAPEALAMGGGDTAATLGTATAGADTAAAAELAATSPGLLSRLLPLIKGVGLPLTIAGAALANDPGQLPTDNPNGTSDPLADLLNPKGTDTGFKSTLKGVARGTAKAGTAVDNALGDVYDYFTQSSDERKAKEKPKVEQPEDAHYTIEQALGLGNGGGAPSGPMVLPSDGPSSSKLDAIEALLMSGRPAQNYKDSPEMRSQMMQLDASKALLDAVGQNLNPNAKAMLALGGGLSAGSVGYAEGESKAAAALRKEQSDWSEKAAKGSLDVEKEKGKSGIKIHATHKGILVEQDMMGDDGKSYKVLQPIGDSIFGGGANAIGPKDKVGLMGKNFSNLDKDPYGKEKMLLSQLESSGELMSVMADPTISKAMQEADKLAMKAVGGAASTASSIDKAKMDARRAVLLKNMAENKKFRQSMIDRVVKLRQHTSTSPSPMTEGADMFSPTNYTQDEENQANAELALGKQELGM